MESKQHIIAIVSRDKKNIVGCISVKSAPIFASGKDP